MADEVQRSKKSRHGGGGVRKKLDRLLLGSHGQEKEKAFHKISIARDLEYVDAGMGEFTKTLRRAKKNTMPHFIPLNQR